MKKLIIAAMVIASCPVMKAQQEELLVEVQPRTVTRGNAKEPKNVIVTQNLRREARESAGRGGGFGGAFSLMQAGGVPTRSLVVLSSGKDHRKTAELSEDLTVMAKIMEDNFPEEIQRDPMRKVLGISVGMHDAQNARNFYLEDYGVVFFQTVTIPLLPAEIEEPKKAKDAPQDSAWEDARQELFGRKKTGGGVVKYRGWHPVEYEEAKVDKLKESLLESLRNASNFRHLKADEFVTIIVSGLIGSGPGEGEEVDHVEVRLSDDAFLFQSPETDGRRATMVIRAKKSDIDEYARKKEMSAFRDKVSVVIY